MTEVIDLTDPPLDETEEHYMADSDTRTVFLTMRLSKQRQSPTERYVSTFRGCQVLGIGFLIKLVLRIPPRRRRYVAIRKRPRCL